MKTGDIAKSFVFIILAMGIAFTMMLSSFGGNIAKAAEESKRVLVVLGDSIAAGSGAGGSENMYSTLVGNALDIEVKNHAIGGAKTGGTSEKDMWELLTESGEASPKAVAAQAAVKTADIINISIGGNDLQGVDSVLGTGYLKGIVTEIVNDTADKPMLEEFIMYYTLQVDRLVDRIKKLNEDALIIWFRNYVPPYYSATGMAADLVNNMFGTANVDDAYLAGVAAIDTVNTIYDEYLKQNPGAFVLCNAYSAFMGPDGKALTSNYYYDLIHPSQEGHKLLADILGESINAHWGTHIANLQLKETNETLIDDNAVLLANKTALENKLNESEKTRKAVTTSLIVVASVLGAASIALGTILIIKSKRV